MLGSSRSLRIRERPVMVLAHGDNHLVLVKQSRPAEEKLAWVYNSADIDALRIVWARYMEGIDHGSLRAHYSDRQAWILEADESPVRLGPHPSDAKDESLVTAVAAP